jgi:hypothetical protein
MDDWQTIALSVWGYTRRFGCQIRLRAFFRGTKLDGSFSYSFTRFSIMAFSLGLAGSVIFSKQSQKWDLEGQIAICSIDKYRNIRYYIKVVNIKGVS